MLKLIAKLSPARMAGLFIFVVATGCGANPETTIESAKPQAGRDEISLSATDAEGLFAAIERHRGDVVLVDFWATWCMPCVEQFPHTVELARKHGERGLAVISVSMDSPKSETQVRAFLQKQDARFENFIAGYASVLEATKALGLPGPVPCYRVYDRKGELKREFGVDPQAAKQFTAADVEAAVVELL
jgi:thiol-disulfide isomerase/thioredoxin